MRKEGATHEGRQSVGVKDSLRAGEVQCDLTSATIVCVCEVESQV